MKKFNFHALIILMFFFAALFSSCTDTEEYKYFLVPVNSVVLPEEVYASEPFDIRFSGTIGLDGCSSFERFITEKQDTVLVVEAWGKLKTNTYICPDMEVELVREKLSCSIDAPGTYLLKIKQPDGSFLDKEFRVH